MVKKEIYNFVVTSTRKDPYPIDYLDVLEAVDEKGTIGLQAASFLLLVKRLKLHLNQQNFYLQRQMERTQTSKLIKKQWNQTCKYHVNSLDMRI